jgi:hypothetical protein
MQSYHGPASYVNKRIQHILAIWRRAIATHPDIGKSLSGTTLWETVRSSIDELVVGAILHSMESRKIIVTAMDGTQHIAKKIGRPIASRRSLFHTAQVRKLRMAGS